MALSGCTCSFASRLLVAGCWAAGLMPGVAVAQDDGFAASFELRGGYDSNPSLSVGAPGTPTAGYAASLALARPGEGYIAGLTVEAGETVYLRGALDPSRSQRAELSITGTDTGRPQADASLRFENLETYDTIYREAVARAKFKSRDDLVRPFLTGELAVFELNEANVLVGDFLPRGHVALRGSLIPGIERAFGDFTLGVSLNVSMFRYRDALDAFGFRRDNERAQPFVYTAYDAGAWSIFASVSYLFGDWHDPDFTDVAEPMFEVQARYEDAGWRVELEASRRAVETTFPVSPVTLDTSVTASVSRAVGPVWRLGVSGTYYETRYLDSPFATRTVLAALDVTRDMQDDVTLGLKLGAARSWPWSGGVAEGVFTQVSLSRQFSQGPGAGGT